MGYVCNISLIDCIPGIFTFQYCNTLKYRLLAGGGGLGFYGLMMRKICLCHAFFS